MNIMDKIIIDAPTKELEDAMQERFTEICKDFNNDIQTKISSHWKDLSLNKSTF